jgi:DNA polymerase III subunit beta
MTVTESGIDLVGTNLEVAVSAAVRARVDTPGAFTVPAKTLLDCVQLLRDEQVELSLDGTELLVKTPVSTTKMKGVPADEFPVVPDIQEENGVVVDAKEFRYALSQVALASAKNEIRPELSGVSMSIEGKTMTLAATDSYRLAERTISLEQGSGSVTAIVPAQTIAECVRLLSLKNPAGDGETQVRMFVSGGQIAFRYDAFEMVSRLIDGQYPDYKQIIPQSFQTTAMVPRDVFINKIKAAGLFTTTGVNAVALSVEPEKSVLFVSSTSTQTGAHDSSIDIEASGEAASTLLNHRYVIDGLQHMDGESVVFSLNGPDAPCLIQSKNDDTYRYIVMPIRQ